MHTLALTGFTNTGPPAAGFTPHNHSAAGICNAGPDRAYGFTHGEAGQTTGTKDSAGFNH